jgi:F-type H+-transporting ATPase subunit gamma
MGANLRVIRRKIKTVTNIWQITRAMHMVAASKLKRVQPRVEASREYLRRLMEVTASVARHVPADLHPYLQERPVQAAGLIVVAGDKGLAGSHNVNILRLTEQHLAAQDTPVKLLTVGNKATDYGRRRAWDIVETYPAPAAGSESHEALLIARQARDLFDAGEIDRLDLIYTEFISPLRRPARLVQILPIVAAPEPEEDATPAEYLFEPPARELLQSLLPRTVEAQVVNLLIQSVAAEHAARMTAMSAATDNAADLRQNLVRQLNRARQERITTELLEVVGGADALAQAE